MGVRNAARAVNSLVPGNLFRAPPTGPAAADVMPRRKPLAVVARTVGASRPTRFSAQQPTPRPVPLEPRPARPGYETSAYRKPTAYQG